MIVDTHVHIVSHDHDSSPLSPRSLSGPWYREAPHSAEDLLACMDRSGVDRADRPYEELVALGRRAFGSLSDRDRDACLGGSAARLWQLG